MPRPRAVGDRRQFIIERSDVLQLDPSVLARVGLRALGIGDHAAMVVQDIADRSRADLVLGEILGEAIQRDVRRRDPGDLPIGVKGRGNGEADQPQGREDIGIGDQQRFLFNGPPVPKPRPRIVAGRLVRCPDLGFGRVEQHIMIDRCGPLGAVDPAIGVLAPLRRQLALDHHIWVDPPRLPEGAVGRSDIHADDLVAVDQDAEQVFERPVRGIEIGLFVADRGRAADQRFDRTEHVLNVADGVGAKPRDKVVRMRPGERIVRQIRNRDDREKHRHGQQHEQRQDGRPQPQLPGEEAFHRRAVAALDTRSVAPTAARPGGVEETKAIFKGSSHVPLAGPCSIGCY